MNTRKKFPVCERRRKRDERRLGDFGPPHSLDACQKRVKKREHTSHGRTSGVKVGDKCALTRLDCTHDGGSLARVPVAAMDSATQGDHCVDLGPTG